MHDDVQHARRSETVSVVFKFMDARGETRTEPCPVSKEDSDPKGGFLVCRAPPAYAHANGTASHLAAGSVTAEVVLITADEPAGQRCGDGCTIEYRRELTPTASTRLTSLAGAPGDTLIIETGNWQVNAGAHPVTGSTVEGTLGAAPFALDQHSSTRPLHEQPQEHAAVGGGVAHLMHLKIPAAVSAGVHRLQVVLDRDDWHGEASQGSVVFAGAAGTAAGTTTPTVVVSPVITEVHPRAAAVGDHVTIAGAGFAHLATDNEVVLPGGHTCSVERTDVHFLVCKVGPAAASATAEARAHEPVHRGIPLRIHAASLETLAATEKCVGASRSAAGTAAPLAVAEACYAHAQHAAAGNKGANANVAGAEHFVVTNELAWPHLHPEKRHDGFREDTFLATFRATLRPPVAGTYTFALACSALQFDGLCAATLRGPGPDGGVELNATHREATVAVAAGAVYSVDMAFSHSKHGEQVALLVRLPHAASSTGQPTSHPVPVPAEWLEHPQDTPASAGKQVGLTVNGIPAFCRSSAGPAGCTWEVSATSTAHVKHASDLHRLATTSTARRRRFAEHAQQQAARRTRRGLELGAAAAPAREARRRRAGGGATSRRAPGGGARTATRSGTRCRTR